MSPSEHEPADDKRAEGDTTPGDAQEVPVPHEQALEGSSEELAAVDGVRPQPADPEPEEANRGGKSF